MFLSTKLLFCSSTAVNWIDLLVNFNGTEKCPKSDPQMHNRFEVFRQTFIRNTCDLSTSQINIVIEYPFVKSIVYSKTALYCLYH